MLYLFRAIRIIRKFEFHLHEYNDKLRYNYFVHVAISQGYHEFAMNFLEKVPSSAKRGREDYNNHFL